MLTGSYGAVDTSLGCSGEATDALGVCLTTAVPSIEANNGGASFFRDSFRYVAAPRAGSAQGRGEAGYAGL